MSEAQIHAPPRSYAFVIPLLLGVGAVGAGVWWLERDGGGPSSARMFGDRPRVFIGSARPYRVHTPAGCDWHVTTQPDADLTLLSSCGTKLQVSVLTVVGDESPASIYAGLQASIAPPNRFEERERHRDRVGDDAALIVTGTMQFQGLRSDEVVEIVRRDDAVYVIEAKTLAPASPARLAELGRLVRAVELPPSEILATPPAPPPALASPPMPGPTPEHDSSDAAERARARARGMQRAARGEPDAALALAHVVAQTGDADATLYWLQRAIADDGLELEDLDDADGLGPVLADPRMAQVRDYARRMRLYLRRHPIERTSVVVPAGYHPGTPIPAVIALHGYGANESDLTDGTEAIATAAGVAFVGVSATRAWGPHHFAWAEDDDEDLARIDRALAEVRDRVTLAPGKVALLGFSQGAQMAAALAARHPERFAGAIAMSPGTMAPHPLTGLASLAGRRFVLAVGGGEAAGNVALTAEDADRLTAAGADVVHRPAPGQRRHGPPPDYEDVLPAWIAYVLDGAPLPAGAR